MRNAMAQRARAANGRCGVRMPDRSTRPQAWRAEYCLRSTPGTTPSRESNAVLRSIVTVLPVVLLGACVSTPMPPQAAVADLAPTGKLRAVINFGNPILASRDEAGQPKGVSVDLACEPARRRLGVDVEVVTVVSAGASVETLASGRVDVGLFAIDPARAATTAYTAPFVQIEGSYRVCNDSPIRSNDETDRNGIRVAVGNPSVRRFLTRPLKRAKIERAPTSPAVIDFFLANGIDVAAGVKQQLEMDSRRVGNLRLLPARFMVIHQAMGMARGKEAGARYLAAFVEEMKASGFVAAALQRHDIDGASVAPPG